MESDSPQQRIHAWLHSPIDAQTKSEILRLQKEDPQTLNEAFATDLAFGTGGMRGLMGVGTCRMNKYTIQLVTQGLANYIKKQPLKRDHHQVFISYDSRINSREFALEAAKVLAGNNIGVYVTAQLRPTPFVSFGVREKECTCGIMITASHNPKEYNGYKVYGADGGQVVAPHDGDIVKEVKKITDLSQVRSSTEHSEKIEWVHNDLDGRYLEAIHKLQVDPKEDKKVGDRLKITYTPLHGAGGTLIPKALYSWGFSNINLVDAQLLPDGNFPTVTHPNPEDPKALALGIQQLQNTRSALLIATDPDADRMAVVTLHKEKPFLFNGNQIAALCLEYLCQMKKQGGTLPQNGACVTTIVSSDLLGKIADHYGLACFEVLTGFKYIGELIHRWEEDGTHSFVFGAEESYGYLIGTHSRDKDAVVMSCLIAEIALLMQVEGKDLVDFLEDIFKKYGFFYEAQHVIEFAPGQEGVKQMQKMMDHLRADTPTEIGGISVTDYEDYQQGIRDLPKSNVLLYKLADHSKLIVRPSGTEPKLKIYAGVHHPTYTGDLHSATTKAKTHMEHLFNALQAHFS